MTPRDGEHQHVLEAATMIEPAAETFASTDAFGNTVLWFQLTESHERMVVESTAIVDVMAVAARGDGQWGDLADPAFIDRWAEFLTPSRFIRWTAPVAALAADLGLPANGSVGDWLTALEQGVNGAIAYTPGATTVDTPVEEVVHARRGVCQDMAHLAIAICRHRGVPARYVSGWLHQPGHDGPAESHAWLEAQVGDAGWVEIDPTHPGMSPDYVRIGIGRDYADVPPIRGSYVGPATTDLIVSVEVVEMEGAE